MRHAVKRIFLATVLSALASVASADEGYAGPYASIGAGLSIPSDVDLHFSNMPPPIADFKGRLNLDKSFNVNGAVGYKWRGGFRAELEGSWRRSDVSGISNGPGSGHETVVSGMANFLYDFKDAADSSFGVVPYIGGGVGFGRQKWKNIQGNLGVPIINASFTAFQWQAIGGLSVPLTLRLLAFVEYRYIKLADKTVNILAASNVRLTDQGNHNIFLGLRYFF
jgi:opacity protein-like surface antigen